MKALRRLCASDSRGNSHQNSIEAQLVHHWTPGGRSRIDLAESHHGVEGRKAKVEVLSPSRPRQRVVRVAARARLQNDLGLGVLSASKEFLEANGAGRPRRFIGQIFSSHDYTEVPHNANGTISYRKTVAIGRTLLPHHPGQRGPIYPTTHLKTDRSLSMISPSMIPLSLVPPYQEIQSAGANIGAQVLP